MKTNEKYKKEPYKSQIELIMNDPLIPLNQRIAKCLFLLEKMVHETADSTQVAILEMNDEIKKINAVNNSSL